MLANDVLHTIGNTPHIRINRLFGNGHSVYIKSERSNPGGSIKDRIAAAMVEAAEVTGALGPGGTIIEPTSGNTGVGLAMVAAVKGYKLILVMPDSMSVERRRLMLAYGATFVLTPREQGMNGAIAKAKELIAATPKSWMPQQFENQANIDVHVRSTAQEIAADFPSGVDALVTGVGTGGHITGCAQVLKAMWPKLKVYAVEPSASPVISGGKPSPHPIQGIGAGFIPKNLHVDLLDGVIQVEAEAAREMARRSAREEGLLVGISSGRRWPRLPRSCRSCRTARRSSGSTTTPESVTCRPRDFCRSSDTWTHVKSRATAPGAADSDDRVDVRSQCPRRRPTICAASSGAKKYGIERALALDRLAATAEPIDLGGAVIEIKAQQHGRRPDFGIEPLGADPLEAEHALIELDMTRVDLDQHVGALMKVENVHAGNVKDRAENGVRAHRLVHRQLRELAKLSAFGPKRTNLIGIQTRDVQTFR
jgi:cysteine synthase A